MKKLSKVKIWSIVVLFVLSNLFAPVRFLMNESLHNGSSNVQSFVQTSDSENSSKFQTIIQSKVFGSGALQFEEDSSIQKTRNAHVNVQMPTQPEYSTDVDEDISESVQSESLVHGEPIYYINLTDSEKHQLACLIYLEARGESEECQYAVGSVVINRFKAGGYDSIIDVIHAKGQFTPANQIKYTTPTDIQISIVEDLCLNGPTVPEYVTYFRADHFHTWDSTKDWKQIDRTYFSINKKLYTQMTGCNP